MRLLALLALVPWAFASAASAQAADPHAGHQMTAPSAAPADSHAGHQASSVTPAPAADPHAGHAMPTQAPPDGETPPPVPIDHDADRFFPAAAIAAARDRLVHEHGAISWSKVSIDKLELRSGAGADGYAWEGRASFGGDINRLVVKSRGEGAGKLHEAELDVLYGRAVTPYFNLEAGLRQDFESRGRTYLTLGLDGVAP